ncbi:MAG: hypothetical protein CW716_12645 [Candidatus Bathyarchaeum sp.]|nr:MAG: hypothetical protein CW716_12645 [Candidatus Bathyarchaeum sp.]
MRLVNVLDPEQKRMLLSVFWLIGGLFYVFFEFPVFFVYFTDPLKQANPLFFADTVILGLVTFLGLLMILASAGFWFRKAWSNKLALISPTLIAALLVTSIIIWINNHLQSGIQLFRLEYWNLYQIWAFSLPHTVLAFIYVLVGFVVLRNAK